MSSQRKLVKHSGIMMFMELGSRMLDALVSVVLARHLGPEGFGLMAFAIAFSALFGILPGFGMGAFMARDIARDPKCASNYVSNGLLLKLILAILTCAMVYGVSITLKHSPEKTYLVMLGTLMMIFETNVRFISAVFQGFQKVGMVAWINLAVRLAWVLLSITMVFFHAGISELLGIRVLIYAAGLIISVILIDRTLLRIKWSFNLTEVWKMAKTSIPFAIFRLFGDIYPNIDTVMLTSMMGNAAAGLYTAGYKFLRIFAFIPSGIFQAVVPGLTKISEKSSDNFVQTVERGIKYLLLVSLPICAVTMIFAKPLVILFYGREFAPAAGVLSIYVWSLIFTFLNSILNASVAAQGQERKGSFIMIGGLVCSAAKNVIVIPLWGLLGVAASTIVVQGLVFYLQVRLVRKRIPGLRVFRQAIRPFMVMLLMMICLWPLRHVNLFLNLGIAFVVFVLGCWIFGAVSREEWKAIKTAVTNKLKKKKMKDDPDDKPSSTGSR